MCLIARIRALITAVVLASYSPVGLAIGHESPGSGHAGHLAISLFIGRRTRVAASQQFDIANRVCIRIRAGVAIDLRLQTMRHRITSR